VRNRPTAVAITGEPGGGKTTIALLLILQLALRGVTIAVIDPKGDAESLVGVLTARAVGRGKPTVVNTYGRQLLWSQAIAADEKPTADVIHAKQAAYAGLVAPLKQNDPGTYALFQGKQWTTRLEIGFAALFASLLAGVLVLLIAITLILLKLGFLLLLVAGPFFLIVGTHPGFGRALRFWRSRDPNLITFRQRQRFTLYMKVCQAISHWFSQQPTVVLGIIIHYVR